MSLLSDNIEKEELEIKKDINTVSGKSLLKNKKSLADMIEEKKKKKCLRQQMLKLKKQAKIIKC